MLIVAGYFLQQKINGKQELKGVKVLILSVILPATIFVALLKINISAELLLLPIGTLALNVLLFFATKKMLPILGIDKETDNWRTFLLLTPSLAPGLSCFPFVVEYLGEESLAMAALADVGNKVFVLIILYLIAMNWYYARQATQAAITDKPGTKSKLKNLGLSLLREPVNLVILLAVAMLCLGLNINALPTFLETTAVRLAALMTPIVLLFIGMAVRFKRQEMALIIRVLAFRAGVGLFASGLAMLVLPAMAPAFALLLVIFPQSAVSFWPFAHMSAVENLRKEGAPSIFNIDLALNILACSLPFSTVIILGVLSCGDYFAQPSIVFLLGTALLAWPIIYVLQRSIWARKRAHTTTPTSSHQSIRLPNTTGN